MRRSTAIVVAIAVQGGRFAVIIAGLALAPALGIRGWDQGLFVNALCCGYAILLVSLFRLWRSIGLFAIRSPTAVLWLIPLALEAVAWLVPAGVEFQGVAPGLWVLTFLLVGINEELVSRGVVLTTLRRALPLAPSVVITATLFGLQHLSAIVTSGASLVDTAWNVALTAIFGFAFAAYQARFSWILPLVLVHAVDDFASVLSPGTPSDLVQLLVSVVLLVTGVLLLRRSRDEVRDGRRSID